MQAAVAIEKGRKTEERKMMNGFLDERTGLAVETILKDKKGTVEHESKKPQRGRRTHDL